MDQQTLIAILEATLDDLVVLGVYPDHEFDDRRAQGIANTLQQPTHRQKFFRANHRISQLARGIEILKAEVARHENDF
ncbi:hypothetical protein [Picosynechococcus sp. PCC 8807]|uniref:hypothetical protein n=1 Tax=Picosynechococcus sp. PCC 8807 TaxID=195248 RepID=UPI000810BD46|nr:hypothetical protein [Picosynechococcus sp. PCC 8807]ANV90780.1 hypothetical protein AWQ24_09125 [Picosynechococcus sp. PCC 8807]